MKHLGAITFFAVTIMVVAVTMGIQLYNLISFRDAFLDDDIDLILIDVNSINDNAIAKARAGIVDSIQKEGYDIDEKDVTFFATVPGVVRKYSEFVYQISSLEVRKIELKIQIKLRRKNLFFDKEEVFEYTKMLRGK